MSLLVDKLTNYTTVCLTGHTLLSDCIFEHKLLACSVLEQSYCTSTANEGVELVVYL